MSASPGLAIDAAALDSVKRSVREDPKAGLRAAAQQFEAMFLQMVLKAMRDTVPEGGLFDGNDTKLYRSMLDQQLSQTLSAGGSTGLAAIIERQLGGRLPVASATAIADPAIESSADAVIAAPVSAADLPPPGAVPQRQSLPLRPAAPAPATPAPQPPAAVGGIGAASVAANAEPASAPAHARDFVAKLWPHARDTSQATGIPAHFLVAHAALETGWGRGEIRRTDGSPSYNLFNIKAGSSWKGATVDVGTTEYVDGLPRKQVERFRAYGSYAEAFADYSNLLQARYGQVIGSRDAGSFARGLQNAGYATDPMYADKLTRIIGGATLRASLAG